LQTSTLGRPRPGSLRARTPGAHWNTFSTRSSCEADRRAQAEEAAVRRGCKLVLELSGGGSTRW